MNETKVKGVVLNSIDYKERDKLVQIFTLENGVISAKLTGCKAPNAKLKFAFQPFCFADYIISAKGDFYSITSASLIESFFDLTKDYNNFQTAFKMLEIVLKVLKKGEINQPLFLLLLKCLNYICYDGINANLVLTKFILETYKLLGYGFNFEQCAECGIKFDNKKYIKEASSEFVCSLCKENDAILLENGIFNALKIINTTSVEKISTIKIVDNILLKGLNILYNNFYNLFGVKL